MKCQTTNCLAEASFNFTKIESRRLVAEKHLCDRHAKEFFTNFRLSTSIGHGSRQVTSDGICVDIEAIAYNNGHETPGCIYAHELGGERRFCIMVDGWAWWSLMAQIKHQMAPYPHTHAAWVTTIKELGGELQDVFIDKVSEKNWWLGKLHINKDGQLVSIDVRACDAYVIAVNCGVPIYVSEKALEMFADRGDTRDLGF
jgi:bifunctional DNase/RNase